MAQVGGNSGSGRKKLETDASLNIVSIIDCLTVLIIYLLAAASFVSLSSLDSTVGNVASGQGASAVIPVVTVELKQSRQVIVSVLPPQATQAEVTSYPPIQDQWDLVATAKAMDAARQRFPSLENVILIADPDLAYGYLVHAADRLRHTLPVVLGVGEAL